MRNQIINQINNALLECKDYFMREQEIQIYLADCLNKSGVFDRVFLEYHIPSIRLNFYPWSDANNIYIDIVILKDKKYYPFEIKFKTTSQKIPYNLFGSSSESILLGHQGAQNIGCYDFWKDIKRLELIAKNFNNVEKGIVLFVTNDERYLQEPRSNTVGYAQFSIHNNRKVEKNQSLDWNGKLSISVNRPSITVLDSYCLNWKSLNLINHKYLLL